MTFDHISFKLRDALERKTYVAFSFRFYTEGDVAKPHSFIMMEQASFWHKQQTKFNPYVFMNIHNCRVRNIKGMNRKKSHSWFFTVSTIFANYRGILC